MRPRMERVIIGERAGVGGEMILLDLHEALWPLGMVMGATKANRIGK
jgi:hypothetical protein